MNKKFLYFETGKYREIFPDQWIADIGHALIRGTIISEKIGNTLVTKFLYDDGNIRFYDVLLHGKTPFKKVKNKIIERAEFYYKNHLEKLSKTT